MGSNTEKSVYHYLKNAIEMFLVSIDILLYVCYI